jgi:hypothetical protein
LSVTFEMVMTLTSSGIVAIRVIGI